MDTCGYKVNTVAGVASMALIALASCYSSADRTTIERVLVAAAELQIHAVDITASGSDAALLGGMSVAVATIPENGGHNSAAGGEAHPTHRQYLFLPRPLISALERNGEFHRLEFEVRMTVNLRTGALELREVPLAHEDALALQSGQITKTEEAGQWLFKGTVVMLEPKGGKDLLVEIPLFVDAGRAPAWTSVHVMAARRPSIPAGN